MRLILLLTAVWLFSCYAALSAEEVVGTIQGYECGDSCYLTVGRSGAKEITALCAAEACMPWNEVAEMPDALLGRKVVIALGEGRQSDAEGNDMGPFPSITALQFVELDQSKPSQGELDRQYAAEHFDQADLNRGKSIISFRGGEPNDLGTMENFYSLFPASRCRSKITTDTGFVYYCRGRPQFQEFYFDTAYSDGILVLVGVSLWGEEPNLADTYDQLLTILALAGVEPSATHPMLQ